MQTAQSSQRDAQHTESHADVEITPGSLWAAVVCADVGFCSGWWERGPDKQQSLRSSDNGNTVTVKC